MLNNDRFIIVNRLTQPQVMEFEAATNSNGIVSEAELGGILSLASDDAAAAEEAFPELAEEGAGEMKEEEEKELPGNCSEVPGKCDKFREDCEGTVEMKEEAGEGDGDASNLNCLTD